MIEVCGRNDPPLQLRGKRGQTVVIVRQAALQAACAALQRGSSGKAARVLSC